MEQSLKPSTSPTRTAMTVGAIAAVLMFVIPALSGLHIFTWVIFTGGVYCGMNRFRKEAGGRISYTRALVAGVQTAFFTSLIMAFACYATVRINPSVINILLDTSEKMLQTSDIPSGIIQNTMQQMHELLTPGVMAAATVLTYSATGCLIALVCACFVKNKQPLIV